MQKVGLSKPFFCLGAVPGQILASLLLPLFSLYSFSVYNPCCDHERSCAHHENEKARVDKKKEKKHCKHHVYISNWQEGHYYANGEKAENLMAKSTERTKNTKVCNCNLLVEVLLPANSYKPNRQSDRTNLETTPIPKITNFSSFKYKLRKIPSRGVSPPIFLTQEKFLI